MMDANTTSAADGRKAARAKIDSEVRIRFAAEPIVGSGLNISAQGVFFLTDGSIQVTIEIDGRDGVMVGELVRVESMGPDQIGIAVKFRPPVPPQ